MSHAFKVKPMTDRHNNPQKHVVKTERKPRGMRSEFKCLQRRARRKGLVTARQQRKQWRRERDVEW